MAHATRMADWAPGLKCVCVVNCAGDKVRSTRDLLPVEHRQRGHHHVRVPSDGRPLTDGAGDGGQLLQVLRDPKGPLHTLEAMKRDGPPGGRAFVHCQQGRSRTGSLAVADLLKAHPGWTLFDAVAYLAARRPEVEINHDYIEALELSRTPRPRPFARAASRQIPATYLSATPLFF